MEISCCNSDIVMSVHAAVFVTVRDMNRMSVLLITSRRCPKTPISEDFCDVVER